MEKNSSGDQAQSMGQWFLKSFNRHFSKGMDMAETSHHNPECDNKSPENLTAQHKSDATLSTSELRNSKKEQEQKRDENRTNSYVTNVCQKSNIFQKALFGPNVSLKYNTKIDSSMASQVQVGIETPAKEKEEHEQKFERSPIVATIQLFHSHTGKTIKDIEADLKILLRSRLNNVEFVQCNTFKEVDQEKMLIVLCIITSRVGTDAAYAIKDIENPGNTVLLLIHVKESYALSKQASSSVLSDKSFKDLGGIFDMAFINGKGIYQCEMNDIALDNVCTRIKHFRWKRALPEQRNEAN